MSTATRPRISVAKSTGIRAQKEHLRKKIAKLTAEAEKLERSYPEEILEQDTSDHLAELQDAFMACHGEDWRSPIDCWIFKPNVERAKEAISFFTATEATEHGERFSKGDPGTMVNLKAVGYREGPAGP